MIWLQGGHNTLTHLSLFSGIGGIDLAAEWAGFQTVCFVEIDKFCQKVLHKHWPDVPLVEDIRDVTREKIMAYTECKRLEGEVSKSQLSEPEQPARCNRGGARASTTHNPITLITGGFPCQPVSVAGKQRGKDDDRWLWPEMLRVISEVRPTWAVIENVAGLVRMGLDDCLSELEGEGFEVQTFLIPACAVNAPHRRDRVFIVAHTSREGLQNRNAWTDRGWSCLQSAGEDSRRNGSQWATEPDVGRVAHGVPSRVDRLRVLGNAVVPQVAEWIGRRIIEHALYTNAIRVRTTT